MTLPRWHVMQVAEFTLGSTPFQKGHVLSVTYGSQLAIHKAQNPSPHCTIYQTSVLKQVPFLLHPSAGEGKRTYMIVLVKLGISHTYSERTKCGVPQDPWSMSSALSVRGTHTVKRNPACTKCLLTIFAPIPGTSIRGPWKPVSRWSHGEWSQFVSENRGPEILIPCCFWSITLGERKMQSF